MTKPRSAPTTLPLRQWLWRSYLRAALVPLLLIELTFVGLYWGTSRVVYQSGAEAVIQLSTDALEDAAQREADVIARRLDKVAALTKVLADETARVLTTPADAPDAEKARYAMTPDGGFYTTSDDGGAAVYYTGFVPVGQVQREKVWRSARIDPLMKSISQSDPLIRQVYFNTFDSYNRIYPYFNVLDIYPPRMNIPAYNFYYEADATHNPDRKVVWTDPYVDPAGSGWMVSAIAPAYGPDRLEAVAGIDVTIGSIIDQVLNLKLPGDSYALLIGRDGTILALPPKGEADFGLTELSTHSYSEAIKEDTFKPSAFNIFRRPGLTQIAETLQYSPSGSQKLMLGRPMLASWSTIAGPSWKLVLLSPEDVVLAKARRLGDQLSLVSKLMLAGLVLFYLLFFAYLWRRAQAMSARVARPLSEIEATIARIAEGDRNAPLPAYEITELQRVGDHLAGMGAKLDAATRAKINFLSAMSHELRTPLNAIIGFSDLLELAKGERLDGDRLRQVHEIGRAGRHLTQLVDGVIELSRIEQDEIRPTLMPTALAPLIAQARDALLDEAAERAIRIDLSSIPADPGKVRADPAVLTRIVTHLLSNAVKYNRDGGEVSVTLDQTDPDSVALQIRDTGLGIPADRQARVFTPFDRLGQENGRIGGTGIGLAICKRLADLTGANLGFRSTEGQGSTFTLRLPRA